MHSAAYKNNADVLKGDHGNDLLNSKKGEGMKINLASHHHILLLPSNILKLR